MSDQQNTTVGWVIFIAAIGMMMGLLSVDIAKLDNWNQAFRPEFVGLTMAHMSVVIAAFIGGKLIPTDRDPNGRISDIKLKEINQ